MATLPLLLALSSGGDALHDIPYAQDSPNQVLDFYFAKSGGAPAPVVVWVHGGGWLTGDEDLNLAAEPWASFREKGHAIAAVRYRLAAEAVFPLPAEDVGRAIQFLRRNAQKLGIDPARVVGYGYSAGANMLGYLAYGPETGALGSPGSVSSRPDAFVNSSGPMDWTLLDPVANRGDYFGHFDLTTVPPGVLQAASPLWHLQNGGPPVPTFSFYAGPVGSPPLVDPHDAYSGVVLSNELLAQGLTSQEAPFHPSTPGVPVAQLVTWLTALGY